MKNEKMLLKFGRLIISLMLIGSIILSCGSNSLSDSETQNLNLQLKSGTGEDFVRELASGAAGELPPPANVIGSALLGQLWETESSTDAILNDMDVKLNTIIHDIGTMKNEIIMAIDEVGDDVAGQIIAQDFRSINSRNDTIIQDLTIDYLNSRTSGIVTTDLKDDLKEHNDVVKENMNLLIRVLQDDNKKLMTFISDYIFMATLHVTILQELIDIHRIENYIESNETNQQAEFLDTYIKNLKDYLNIHIEKLEGMIPEIIDYTVNYRMNNLEYEYFVGSGIEGYRIVDDLSGYISSPFTIELPVGTPGGSGYRHRSLSAAKKYANNYYKHNILKAKIKRSIEAKIRFFTSKYRKIIKNANNIIIYMGDYTIETVSDIQELRNKQRVEGDLYIQNTTLTTLEGLNNLTFIKGDLIIQNNDALTTLEELKNLTSIEGDLIIQNNDALTTLEGLNNLTSFKGDLIIQDNDALTTLEGLNMPQLEIGNISNNQLSGSKWNYVSFDTEFIGIPIVVMSPVSYNGPDPTTTRVRNVSTSGFEFQLDEWDYKNGTHTTENVSYLAVTPGTYKWGDFEISAGKISNINHKWQQVTYSKEFLNTPVVLAQQVSDNGHQATSIRLDNVNSSNFKIRLQEEELNDGIHVKEAVNYIAISPGTGLVQNYNLKVGRTGNSVGSNWYQVDFGDSYADPKFLAATQTTNGLDPIALRYKNLTETGVKIFCEEEQSKDQETSHINEVVGWIAITDN